jgi:hypothetical protein
MFRRMLLALPLFVIGCAGTPPAPRRRPAAATSLPERVRREPWMTRFWAELTPAERRRVQARLRHRDPAVASQADAAKQWDPLGLPQRNALLFGSRGMAGATPTSGQP